MRHIRVKDLAYGSMCIKNVMRRIVSIIRAPKVIAGDEADTIIHCNHGKVHPIIQNSSFIGPVRPRKNCLDTGLFFRFGKMAKTHLSQGSVDTPNTGACLIGNRPIARKAELHSIQYIDRLVKAVFPVVSRHPS